MSIKFAVLILVVASAVNSCTDKSQNHESLSINTSNTIPNEQFKPTDTIKEEKPAELPKYKPDSIIKLSFSKDAKSLRVKGHLDKPGAIVTCFLTVNKSVRLTGSIKADKSPANIRFNQIVMPNGQSDGPFGQQFEYNLPQPGVYKIKIGHNLMAEDAYVGDFILYLTIH
jgi:hypothetical protein